MNCLSRPRTIWTTTLALVGLLGCRDTVEADSASGSESTGTDDEVGVDTSSSSESSTDSTTESSTDSSTDTSTDSATDTSTDSSTDTSTDSSTDTSTDSTTDTGGLPCADVCGTIDCGACPDTPMIDGPGGAYRIDATETTVAEYSAFEAVDFDPVLLSPECAWKVDLGGFVPEAWDAQLMGDLDLPVTGVDWCDAQSYCNWTGRRLCGQIGGGPDIYDQLSDPNSEWFAACSDAGTQTYPYGNNYQAQACNGVDLGVAGLTPVGSLPACEGGLTDLFDMSGNVWEWTNTCLADPMLDDIEQNCRRRGGSWFSTSFVLRCAVDSVRTRGYRADNTGIRCCDAG